MTDRRLHQCHRDQCDSQAVASCKLHLTCRVPGGHAVVVAMNCSLQVCEKHKDYVRGYVLSPANQESIRTGLMEGGYPEPDFMSARIEFVPLPVEVVVVPKVIGCDREGCANPAAWRIKTKIRHIRQRGRGPFAAETLTNIHVCSRHKGEVKAADLLMGDDRANTMKFLNNGGMVLPDLDGMELEFVPLAVKLPIG